MVINIKSSGVYYSLHEWYYSNQKAGRIPYEIFTYWSEEGGLDKLFSKLNVKEANVGESFYFELDSKNELGCERDLVDDFKTQTFKVINLRHEYLSDGNGGFEFCKLYNLEPHIV